MKRSTVQKTAVGVRLALILGVTTLCLYKFVVVKLQAAGALDRSISEASVQVENDLRVLESAKRLLAIEVPRVYADPDRVSDALYRMLARRPRLALAAEDRASVCTWLRAVQPRVADARIALADGLVPAVRERFTGA